MLVQPDGAPGSAHRRVLAPACTRLWQRRRLRVWNAARGMQRARLRHPRQHGDAGGRAMGNLGLLVLRLAVGGLLAGHGAQKLFGSFDGPGFTKTAGHMEKMGLQPGHVWASMATAGEFGGGLLMALGLANPLAS